MFKIDGQEIQGGQKRKEYASNNYEAIVENVELAEVF